MYSSEIKFEKIIDGLNKPWSLSFIDKENLIITEKSGKLLTLNLKKKKLNEIKHNLSVLKMAKVDYLMYYTIINKFIFHILKTEEIGKQALP